MPGIDRIEAPAVSNSPTLCELREYSKRAPHLSFGQAMRHAIVDALKDAARCAAKRAGPEATNQDPFIAIRRQNGDF
jgi:hypothetical protein